MDPFSPLAISCSSQLTKSCRNDTKCQLSSMVVIYCRSRQFVPSYGLSRPWLSSRRHYGFSAGLISWKRWVWMMCSYSSDRWAFHHLFVIHGTNIIIFFFETRLILLSDHCDCSGCLSTLASDPNMEVLQRKLRCRHCLLLQWCQHHQTHQRDVQICYTRRLFLSFSPTVSFKDLNMI